MRGIAHYRRRRSPVPGGEGGFTLVEISAAVAILGAALTTIITLQTRLVDTFVHERNLLRATLYAQYLMTFVEISPSPPDPSVDTQPLDDALRERGYFDGLETAGTESSLSERRAIDGWEVETRVTPIPFFDFEDVARRVDLTVRWGKGDDEQTSLMLYVKSKD